MGYRKQYGFVIWIYIGVALLILGIGATVVVLYTNAIKDKEKAESDLRTTKDTLEATNTALAIETKAREALDKQLVQRRNTSNVIKQVIVKENIIIETAKAESKETVDWATTLVPIDLLNRLRDSDTSKDSDTKANSSIGIPDTRKDTELERATDSDK